MKLTEGQDFNDEECLWVCGVRECLAADLDATSGSLNIKATLLSMFTNPSDETSGAPLMWRGRCDAGVSD